MRARLSRRPGGKVFLSYRRDDAPGLALALAEAIGGRYGRDGVFIDRAGIAAGDQFPEVIHGAIQSSDVFLVLIGPNWLTSDATGRPRLDHRMDWVRQEILAAYRRGVRVIPVLLEGASMPSSRDLPRALARLATSNAVELSGSRWEADVRHLVGIIDRHRRDLRRGRWGTWGQLTSEVGAWRLIGYALTHPFNLAVLAAVVVTAALLRPWLYAVAVAAYVALVVIALFDETRAKQLARRLAGRASASPRPPSKRPPRKGPPSKTHPRPLGAAP